MRAGLDSHQQRLRLSDLRHFGRRRETIERRREDGVGFGGAGGRLIEFGEGERGAQFEAPGPCAAAISMARPNAASADAVGGIVL